MRKTLFIAALIVLVLSIGGGIVAAQDDPPPPPPDGGGGEPPPPPGDGDPPPRPEDGNQPPGGGPGGGPSGTTDFGSAMVAELDISSFETFGDALAAQVTAGDGNGIDMFFRNSGVVIDEEAGTYFAVNGVHPVNQGDYSSYYPKSIVEASMADDTIVRVFPFGEVNGHDVDMEALAWGPNEGFLYVGDEYNYIYEIELESGLLTREWNLADVGISTGTDRGIEAMTYSPITGYFYAGIQDSGEVHAVELNDDLSVTLVDTFPLPMGWAPSGLFGHADGTLWAVSMSGGGGSGQQMIFHMENNGDLLCAVSIPSALNMTRPDGIAFDIADENVYIVDSQGPINGGFSLYKVAWTTPC